MNQSDLPSILEIQAACYTEVEPESYDSLLSKLCASPETCLVAVSSGSTVAYLLALPWKLRSPPALNSERCLLPRLPDCLYLHDLAVSPLARRHGIGDALFTKFLSALRHFQFAGAMLIAVQGSVAYWKRYGFQEISLDGDVRNTLSTYGTDAAYMELDAPPPSLSDLGRSQEI